MRLTKYTHSFLVVACFGVFTPAIPAFPALIGNCTIIVQNGGMMKINPQLNSLSSRHGGGSSASVAVNPQSLLCNILALLDCYSISAIAPTSFSAFPPGGNDNISFHSIFRINGGADRPGIVPIMVANGMKTVEVDLTVDRTSTFPTGNYEAVVVVRCE